MDAKINKGNIVFIDPSAIPFPSERLEVSQPIGLDAQWQTPGLYLTQKVASNPLVRFIGEKVQADYLQIIVVIDDDPEELLDKIFPVEQEMYNKFRGLRFDMRLRVISSSENIEVIKQSTIIQYDRDKI